MSKLALRLVVVQNGTSLDPANLSGVDTSYPLEISLQLFHGPNIRLSSYVVHPQILQSLEYAAMQSGRNSRHHNTTAGSGSGSGAGIMLPQGVAPRPIRGSSGSTGMTGPAPGQNMGVGKHGVPQWSASATPPPNSVGTLTNWQPPGSQQQQVMHAGTGGSGGSALLRSKEPQHINTNTGAPLPPKLGLPSPSSAMGLAGLHGLPGSGSNTPVPNSGRDSHRSLGGNNTDRSDRGDREQRERERAVLDGSSSAAGAGAVRAPPGGVTVLSSPIGGANLVTVLSGGSSGGVASPRPASPSLRNSNASVGSTFSSGKAMDAEAVLHRLHRATAASTSSTAGGSAMGAVSTANNNDEPGSQTEGAPHGAGAKDKGSASAGVAGSGDDHAHSSSLVPSFFTGDDKDHASASANANPNPNPVAAPSSGKGLALGGLLGGTASSGGTASGAAIWESPAFGSLSPSILPQSTAIYSPSLSGQKTVAAPGSSAGGAGGAAPGHHRSGSGHHSASGSGQMHPSGGGAGGHGSAASHLERALSPHQPHGSLQHGAGGNAGGHHSARSPPVPGHMQSHHHGGGGGHHSGQHHGGMHSQHSQHPQHTGAPSPHHGPGGAGGGGGMQQQQHPHGMHHSPHQSVSHLPSPRVHGGGGASPHTPSHQLMHHPHQQHGMPHGGAPMHGGGGMHPQHGHGHGHGHAQSPQMGGSGAAVMSGAPGGGAGGPTGQAWPMNVITESPLRVCKANELCEDPSCPRMHGEFEPKQDEFFRAYPNEKALQVVCVWNMRGFCRLAERCGYRHLKQLFPHRPLTAAQREKLENPTITKKKYT